MPHALVAAAGRYADFSAHLNLADARATEERRKNIEIDTVDAGAAS
jgi:hypothetical protein